MKCYDVAKFRQWLPLLLYLAALAPSAAATSLRLWDRRGGAAPRAAIDEAPLKPDAAKETLLVDQNAVSLLRFLDQEEQEAVVNAVPKQTASFSANASAAPAPADPQPASPTLGTYEEFKAGCLAHVHALVDNMDRSYTDVQLENALKHECTLESQFPAAKEDGFHTEAACHEFAELLTQVRHEEVRTGSQQGYDEFCQKYYEHRSAHHIGLPTAKPLHAADVDVESLEYTLPDDVAPPTQGGIRWVKLVVLLVVAVGLIALGLFMHAR